MECMGTVGDSMGQSGIVWTVGKCRGLYEIVGDSYRL